MKETATCVNTFCEAAGRMWGHAYIHGRSLWVCIGYDSNFFVFSSFLLTRFRVARP